MAKTFEIEGFDELLEALEQAPEIARPIMAKKMTASLQALRGILQPYPPQPDRNRARSFNTYARGFGQRPRSYFGGGSRQVRSLKALGRATSERLGTKWTQEVEIEPGAITGVIGNTASYANVVQGDSEDQNYWHGVTGWITMETALEEANPEIFANFSEGVDEILVALGRR